MSGTPTTSMPAGPELDALVDEKVMGEPAWERNTDGGFRHQLTELSDGGFRLRRRPSIYSTDIGRAWTVVRHLQPRVWFKITVGMADPRRGDHRDPAPTVDIEVGVYARSDGRRSVGAHRLCCATVPLNAVARGICEAALAAVAILARLEGTEGAES